MKFNRQTWLIIGLTGIIIYLILSRPSRPDSSQIIQARDSIQRIAEENRILAMSGRTLETRLAQATVKSKSDSTRFYREITVKNQQLARKRVQIDTVFKDSPVLQSYLRTADSVFFMMRERIDTLEKDLAFRQGLYDQMIYIQNKQATNLNMIIGQKDAIIADQAKTIKKKSPKRLGNIIKEVGKDVGFFLIGFGIGKGSG